MYHNTLTDDGINIITYFKKYIEFVEQQPRASITTFCISNVLLKGDSRINQEYISRNNTTLNGTLITTIHRIANQLLYIIQQSYNKLHYIKINY